MGCFESAQTFAYPLYMLCCLVMRELSLRHSRLEIARLAHPEEGSRIFDLPLLTVPKIKRSVCLTLQT